jgi:diguanylate cyclase (GGDEF)-like protein/PAS domain S-box-containing protein
MNQLPSVEVSVQKERLDLLFNRSISASLTLAISSFIYIALFAKIFPWQSLSFWYLILAIILIFRMLLVKMYRGNWKQSFTPSRWRLLFRLGVLATGLTLGSLNIFFFPATTLSYQLLAIIYPYGITAGALIILLDFKSFLIYALTLLLPVVYQTALVVDDLPSLGVGLLTGVLLFFFLKYSREIIGSFENATRLRYENESLLESIQQEKNTLCNRMGRIFNDSSTEIFVIDAHSLKYLQVNKGAVDNLGYSSDEFTGLSLLAIFTDLNESSLSDLLSPLYTGQHDTVLITSISRRKDGSTYLVEARIQLSIQENPPTLVVVAHDITERKEWEEKLLNQVNFDQLTGLRSRCYMQSFMDTALSRSKRHGKKMGLLFIDLDNFKTINDTLGHRAGDEILRQTASRIRLLLRESDTSSRTGGDEFIILLEDLREGLQAGVVAEKLIESMQKPFLVDAQEMYVTISIGISIYPDDAVSLEQLMQFADIAMYHAKKDGRNTYQFFFPEMSWSSKEKAALTHHLRFALSKNEFSLVFQPKVDIQNGRIIGAEALLRWHNQELGNVAPDRFIHLAEQSGVIVGIGNWVLLESCKEAMRWNTIFGERITVSVNVSARQFHAGGLFAAVKTALSESGLPREQLELEITESLLLQDSTKPLAIMQSLRNLGVSLALDDFGTGYSSLAYLNRFPLQVLKIDRSFISEIEKNQGSLDLVKAIIAMAKSLHLEIVAEGVENKKQLELLRSDAVSVIQGYYFSPPLPAEKFRSLLQNNTMAIKL